MRGTKSGAPGKAQAERWHPDRLRPMYAEFFGNVRLNSGPPFAG